MVQSENILLRFVRRGHADDGCSCNHRAVPPVSMCTICTICTKCTQCRQYKIEFVVNELKDLIILKHMSKTNIYKYIIIWYETCRLISNLQLSTFTIQSSYRILKIDRTQKRTKKLTKFHFQQKIRTSLRHSIVGSISYDSGVLCDTVRLL